MVDLSHTIFQRAALLMGNKAVERAAATRVIVFGVGGVGSWCAEGLVRSGVGHITIVDPDSVSVSNINRQLMADSETVGQAKVEVLRRRLLAINPDAQVIALQKAYCDETAGGFALSDYDYIIDAIDSVNDKILLILRACQTDAVFFSSMGAALKLDPTLVRTAEFWKIKGDPLARVLRKRFKKQGIFPCRKFQCVFSEERSHNMEETAGDTRVNGSVVHVTAVFGFVLAGLVLQDIKDGAVRE